MSKKPPSRCYMFPKQLGGALQFTTEQAMKNRGFLQPDLLRRWADIMGKPLCDHCTPIKLVHAGPRQPQGSLHIRCRGAWALEIQLQEPIILERLSMLCGYRVASRIIILR